MSKFYGQIGYAVTQEVSPGDWKEQIQERHHYGDILKDTIRSQDQTSINPDLVISNRISIISDNYMKEHFSNIRYVKWLGSYWKVTSAEITYPRIILTLGGVYNGPVFENRSSS